LPVSPGLKSSSRKSGGFLPLPGTIPGRDKIMAQGGSLISVPAGSSYFLSNLQVFIPKGTYARQMPQKAVTRNGMPMSPHQLLATRPIMIIARPAASRKILSELPMFFSIFIPCDNYFYE